MGLISQTRIMCCDFPGFLKVENDKSASPAKKVSGCYSRFIDALKQLTF